jgi:hypothetical protein
MPDKRWLFRIELSGIGDTPEEAWEHALEGFFQDPGAAPGDANPDTESDYAVIDNIG